MLRLFYPAVLITLMFFFSGFQKIRNFAKTSTKFAKKIGVSLGFGQLIILCVIALEIIAPLIVAAYTFTGKAPLVPFFKLAVLGLMAFTILATALYHNPLKSKENYYAFMSNTSAFGGLMALYVSV